VLVSWRVCVCVCVIARADWINVIFALTSTGLSYRALLCENKHIWEEENSWGRLLHLHPAQPLASGKSKCVCVCVCVCVRERDLVKLHQIKQDNQSNVFFLLLLCIIHTLGRLNTYRLFCSSESNGHLNCWNVGLSFLTFSLFHWGINCRTILIRFTLELLSTNVFLLNILYLNSTIQELGVRKLFF